MSFIDKFEMLDPLTKDDLQTYVGRERDSGRAVLIHLIPRGSGLCSEYGLAQILLRHFAGGKSGPILDAGESPDASRYYVVTEMPVDDALKQSWLGSYRKAHGDAPHPTLPSQDISPKLNPSAPPSEPRTANNPKASNSAIGSSSATNLVNGVAEDGLVPVEPPPTPDVSSESGEFTKLWHGFHLGQEPLGVEPKASSIKPTGAPHPDSESHSAGGQSSATQAFGVKGIPDSPHSEHNGEGSSFTRMFQTPSVEANPSKDDSGAFTKFFSSPETAKPLGADSGRMFQTPSVEANPSKDDSGAFTKFFSSPETAKPLGDSGPVSPAHFPGEQTPFGAEAGTNKREESGAFSMLLKSPANQPESIAPPRPAADRSPNAAWAAHSVDSGEAGATRLFAVPKQSVPAESAPAVGPSDFTRVVAAPPAHMMDVPSPVSSAAGPNAGRPLPPPIQVSAAAPALSMPQPVSPSPLPTPIVNAPFAVPTPSFQSPAMPPIPPFPMPGGGSGSVLGGANAPAIHSVTQGSAGPIPRNFLYLVLSLNLLFGIAVLLIVYFAVRH